MRASLLLLALVAGACGGGGSSTDPALSILPTTLPAATQGTAYSVALFGFGGSGKGYTWRLAAGPLPSGIGGLPASGATATLAGTPGASGAFPLTIELRDDVGATVLATFTLAVLPAGGPGPGPGPGTGTWTATSVVNAPSARAYHTAIWTGTEMIVWGGLDFLGIKNTGGAYDPATATWRTLPTAGAPSARFGHTAVWTGSEMVIWGGVDGVGHLGDGAAYRPSTNTWRPISTTGAPVARASHTAVWGAGRMLVWGGEGTFPPPAPNAVDLVFGDGGVYDPVADGWTAIPAASAPPASRGHTVVWTGTRMAVWGGRDSFALLLVTQNSGGLFEPVSGAWTLTDTLTAPAPRMSHTAIWSGSEMIVWGGRTDSSSWLGSGGRHSPGSNSWTATSTSGAPSARNGHTAVWSGSEMLIWGGRGGTGILGDGGAYDPASNTWRMIATSAAPAGRADHTAVWTGTTMIVWGGAIEPADTYVNSGAVLTP